MKSENQRVFLSFIDLITYLHVLSNDHVYFTLENMAKTYFENLKKRYNKKQNTVKRATRSGAGRDDVSRYENEVKKYAFLAWLDKDVVPRESKTNVPENLENSEKDFGFGDDNSDISMMMAQSH